MNPSPFAVTCVCPSCFEVINLGKCRIVSGRTTGKVLKDPSKGLFASLRVEPLDGPQYTLELARRECTNCQYLLPLNIESVPSLTLAVVGDTFSGKSHYIAALIHQIKADWMANASGFARFTCLTLDVEKQYTQNYFQPLFGSQPQTIQPTLPGTVKTPDPLIYKLVVSPSSKHLPTTLNLMIYDISGEDFENPDRVVQFARFTFNTNAFIFLVDPYTIPLIHNQIPPTLQHTLQPYQNIASGRTAVERLNTIIEVFERFHSASDGSSLPDIPIAVMLSKADIFEHLDPPQYYKFKMPPRYGDGVNLQDINVVDQEVRGLLRAYKQGELLASTHRFKRIKFLATSATGEPPDTMGHYRKVEPHRCLDPMLWILHELGIIRSSV